MGRNSEIFTPEEARHHHHFPELANVMNEQICGDSPVYDFGAGDAWYTGINAPEFPKTTFYAIEGSLNPAMLSGVPLENVTTIQWDLRNPAYFGVRGTVFCIEVMEHIHAEYHDTVMDTLSRHCAGTLLLSWAVRGQTGTRHVAERNENEVVPYVAKWGFSLDREKSEEYRRRVGSYFSNSLYLFRRG